MALPPDDFAYPAANKRINLNILTKRYPFIII